MIDFGTARDLGRTAKERMAGKTRVYTEGYAPPEQIVGKPEPRSDLFALAATLYPPGDRQGARGLLHRQGARDAAGRAERRACPAEHRWFYELIKINLAEDVNDRYFSAKEIKADLDKQQVTQGGALPQVQDEQQGPRAVLRQVRRAADRRDGLLQPVRQEQPHGQPVLHPLWQPFAVISRHGEFGLLSAE